MEQDSVQFQSVVEGGDKRKTKSFMVLLIVAAILVVAGIIGYVIQAQNGMASYSNQLPWGLYIAAFYTVAALGAGLLIVTGAGALFGVIDNKLSPMLFTAAGASFIAAGLLVFADLGSPGSIMSMLTSPNTSSPLFADMLVLLLGIIMAFINAVVFLRSCSSKEAKSLVPKILAVLGIIVGAVVIAVEAGLLAAGTGMLSISVLLGFGPSLIHACLIALCLIVIFNPKQRQLSIALAVFAISTAVIAVADAAVGMGATATGLQFTNFITSPFLWVSVVCALIAALCAFIKQGMIAAIFGIVSVLFLKIVAIWAGQSVALVVGAQTAPGISFDLVEILVILGTIGVGVLILALYTMLCAPKTNTEKEAVE